MAASGHISSSTGADSSDGTGISAKEAEVYDRQIRLWGVEAQKRMKASKVLFIGVTGTSAEAMKNVVLSGMNAVVADTSIVEAQHVGANVLLAASFIGKTVRQSC